MALKRLLSIAAAGLMLTLPSCKSFMHRPIFLEPPSEEIFAKHDEMQLKKHRQKLIAAGANEGQNIKIALHYISYTKVKIPEARALIISGVESFLEMANAPKELEKREKKSPLTYRDIIYHISFATTDGLFQAPPYVAYVCLEDGIIYYSFQDEVFGEFTEEEEITEAYTEALNCCM